ncbi:hypothetical protein NQ317_001722 [Molorchus minor]|uniref:Arrestin C-terminal-like domain-containing protein n=1 Tax=Molorchus minor TaxID=1323400 RepID=A0ABQ9IXV3_9CUCU|nr:hypothetical protein NQ317_001722 [Molorchus minor]
MSSCILHLDNYSGQFSPGDTIVGRVCCSFNSPKSIRGIKLKLSGKEHTEWTERESYYDSTAKETKYRTVTYTGNNSVLCMEQTIVGQGDLPQGRHEYSFSFILPTNLPGTFHGRYGSIKFSVKVTVDRPYKIDYVDEKEFNLVAPINFNDIKGQLQLEPVAYSDEKMLCCFWCASGPITMNVHMVKEAFVVGETVPIKIEITNMSNENVETIEVKMGTTVKSTVTSPSTHSKTDHELIATCRDGESAPTGIGATTSDWKYRNPQFCTLFQETTKIGIVAAISGCHSNMDVDFEVILGHIPVGGQQNHPTITEQYPVGGSLHRPYPETHVYLPGTYPPSPVPPYPVSPSQIVPVPVPVPVIKPIGDGIGFVMPQPIKAPPTPEFPRLPSTNQNTAPYPVAPSRSPMLSNEIPVQDFAPPSYLQASAPSAPPMDCASRTSSKEHIVDDGFVMVKEDIVQIISNSFKQCRAVLFIWTITRGTISPVAPLPGGWYVTSTAPKNIRGILVSYKVTEHTSWMDTEHYTDPIDRRQKTRWVRFHGDYTIYKLEIPLQGPGTMVQGCWSTPSPSSCPKIYQNSYGWIQHFIKAKVDRPLKFDMVDKKQAIVISLIDFNDISDKLQMHPLVYSVEKTLNCCCCKSDPISMNVRLDKEGFILGEMAKIVVDIKNTSTTNIDSVNLEIATKIVSKTVYPRTRTKRERTQLVVANDTGVEAGGERSYNFVVQIPPSAVLPKFNLCRLFTKWTNLKVVAVLPTPHTNMKSKSILTLGHVPLGQQPQYFTSQAELYQPMISYIASAPQPPYAANAIGFITDEKGNVPPNNRESAPPTYEEATSSK